MSRCAAALPVQTEAADLPPGRTRQPRAQERQRRLPQHRGWHPPSQQRQHCARAQAGTRRGGWRAGAGCVLAGAIRFGRPPAPGLTLIAPAVAMDADQQPSSGSFRLREKARRRAAKQVLLPACAPGPLPGARRDEGLPAGAARRPRRAAELGSAGGGSQAGWGGPGAARAVPAACQRAGGPEGDPRRGGGPQAPAGAAAQEGAPCCWRTGLRAHLPRAGQPWRSARRCWSRSRSTCPASKLSARAGSYTRPVGAWWPSESSLAQQPQQPPYPRPQRPSLESVRSACGRSDPAAGRSGQGGAGRPMSRRALSRSLRQLRQLVESAEAQAGPGPQLPDPRLPCPPRPLIWPVQAVYGARGYAAAPYSYSPPGRNHLFVPGRPPPARCPARTPCQGAVWAAARSLPPASGCCAAVPPARCVPQKRRCCPLSARLRAVLRAQGQ